MPTRRPDPIFAKKVGRNIQKLRDEISMTQERLAEQIGVSARYVQMIEAGTGLPSLSVASDIKKILKTNWNSLLD